MPSGKIFALQGEEIVAKLIYVFTIHLHAKAAMQDTVILFALTRKSPVNICFVYFLCIDGGKTAFRILWKRCSLTSNFYHLKS